MDTIHFDLNQWLHSAAETYLNFSEQVLQTEDFLTGDDLIIGETHQDYLSGSMLVLTVGGNHHVKVTILAEEKVWFDIARIMLGSSESTAVNREDMQDAVKEIANIIAGGVKSHLSTLYENSMLLGLPEFIAQDNLIDEPNTLWGKIAIHKKEVFIKIHVMA